MYFYELDFPKQKFSVYIHCFLIKNFYSQKLVIPSSSKNKNPFDRNAKQSKSRNRGSLKLLNVSFRSVHLYDILICMSSVCILLQDVLQIAHRISWCLHSWASITDELLLLVVVGLSHSFSTNDDDDNRRLLWTHSKFLILTTNGDISLYRMVH